MKNPVTPFDLSKLKCGAHAALRVATISGTIVLAAAMSSCAPPPSAAPAPEAASIVQPDQPDPSATATASASDAATPAPAETAEASVQVAAAPAAEAPVPVAAPEAPAPAPAPSNEYSVRAGDTVGTIASAAGVNPGAMLAANGLSTYSIIVPGQVLKLTGPPIAVAPSPAVAPAAVPAAAATPAVPAARGAAPAPVAAPAAGRTIYVAGSGGQAMVDKCIGPIHFTPDDAYSLFIVEHDTCGGWGRFSGIQVGETVTISGYGTYTVTARGQVPNPGTTNNVVATLGGMPRAVLQTCIPGTNQMLVIGLN